MSWCTLQHLSESDWKVLGVRLARAPEHQVSAGQSPQCHSAHSARLVAASQPLRPCPGLCRGSLTVAAQSPRSASASAAMGTGAEGARAGTMHHGGEGPFSPRACFDDPMARGRRAPEEPCVGPSDAAWEWRISRESTSWRSDPTLRWRFFVRRRVKWTFALVPDFWVAEQGVVWAVTAKDTEGMPRGVGMCLCSRRGAKRRWRG